MVLGYLVQRGLVFSITGLSPSMVCFSKTVHLKQGFVTLRRRYIDSQTKPHYPKHATHAGYYTRLVWALPVSLAATQGITVVFFSSGYLDVSVPLVHFLNKDIENISIGCPIRKSPDLSLFAASRGLSQLNTSFFAF